MRYDLVIFDFDGTLADSFPFFVSVQNKLAQRHGFRAIPNEDIDGLRHLPARELMRHVGLPRWKLPFVARGFIRHMREEGGNVRLFPGVAPALDRLHASGATLALVTSNAADNCRRVLGDTHYGRIAHVECGASILGKQRRLRRTLAATGFPAGNAIYVGDQAEDAMAARAAGVAFAAVSWGYATPAALQAHAPDVVLDRVDAIGDLRHAASGFRD